MARKEKVAILDPGPTWLTCMVGEMDANARIQISGYKRVAPEGWRNGAVADQEKAIQTVLAAWSGACEMARVKIDSVYVSITGEHIRFFRGKGAAAVRRPRKGIAQDDLDEVIKQAQAMNLPPDEVILHVFPIQFIVDGQKGVTQPKGLFGMRLDVEVHTVISTLSAVENVYRVVQGAGLRVRGLLLRGIAAALGATDADERRTGVAVVNIGALTDILVYKDNTVRLNKTLGLGGDHITNDISLVLRIPQPTAEKLKLESGVAMTSRVDSEEPINIQLHNVTKQVSPRLLASIIEPRVEEILVHADGEIRKSGLTELLSGGVVLTGGTAHLPGIDALAEQVMNLPVRVGSPFGMTGPEEILADPSYVPACGMLRHALNRGEDFTNTVILSDRQIPLWKRLVRQVKARKS